MGKAAKVKLQGGVGEHSRKGNPGCKAGSRSISGDSDPGTLGQIWSLFITQQGGPKGLGQEA